MSANTNNQLRRLAEKKSGSSLPETSKRHVINRLYQLVTGDAKEKQWAEAQEHIAEHFHRIKDKPKHTVFAKKYRDIPELRQLIAETLSRPSETTYSLLTENGNPEGNPCLLIHRHFSKQIGESEGQNSLRVIGDMDGKLISAFPVASPSGKIHK